MDIVYLNGRFLPAQDAQISVFDRGFLYGDSVYEVIPFYQGRGFRLAEHLARLRSSLAQVDIHSELDWAEVLQDLVQHNGGGNLSVYLQISRGNAGERKVDYDPALAPTVFACCRPIVDNYSKDSAEVRPIRAAVLLDKRDLHCDIKSTCLQTNILTFKQAKSLGADEAIQVRDGCITEGTSSNVFLVKAGVLYTPCLGDNILGGVTRQLVLELAEANGIACVQGHISYAELVSADEVWISSSTRAIVPVTQVDDQIIADGQSGVLWQRMYRLFTQYQQALMTGLQHD